MIVSDEQIEILLRKVEHIRQEIRLYTILGDILTPSVEDLQTVIQRMYNLAIEKYEVGSYAIYLQNMVLRYGNGNATVLVRSGFSAADRKCAVVKELCHLALDEPEDWSPKAKETLNGLIETFRLEVSQNGQYEPSNKIIICEHLAMFAATELLYPEEYRDQDTAQLKARGQRIRNWQWPDQFLTKVIRIALHQMNRASCAPIRDKLRNEKNAL